MILVPLYQENQKIGKSRVTKVLGRFPRSPNSPKLSWTYELECSCKTIYTVNQDWIKKKYRNNQIVQCDECHKKLDTVIKSELSINWGYDPKLPMSEW
jgi:uncharacterized protein YlaI